MKGLMGSLLAKMATKLASKQQQFIPDNRMTRRMNTFQKSRIKGKKRPAHKVEGKYSTNDPTKWLQTAGTKRFIAKQTAGYAHMNAITRAAV
jgi:hypothetical protein